MYRGGKEGRRVYPGEGGGGAEHVVFFRLAGGGVRCWGWLVVCLGEGLEMELGMG